MSQIHTRSGFSIWRAMNGARARSALGYIQARFSPASTVPVARWNSHSSSEGSTAFITFIIPRMNPKKLWLPPSWGVRWSRPPTTPWNNTASSSPRNWGRGSFRSMTVTRGSCISLRPFSVRGMRVGGIRIWASGNASCQRSSVR